MSHIVARVHPVRRIAAMIALAVIASLTVTLVTTAPASAAGSADNAEFRWISAALTADAGTPGVPDVGDTVTLTFEVSAADDAPGDLNWFLVLSAGYATLESPAALAPGESATYTADVTVGPLMLDQLGGGPHLLGGMFTFGMTGNGLAPKSFGIPAPPVAYTAPTPITVSTSFDMTEVYGSEVNTLVEGDQVRYVTRVTNTSAVDLEINGTGFTSPALPLTLGAGDSVDLFGATVDVTYDHMAAGGVSFPDASVDWRVSSGLLSGTVPAPVGTAPTEAIDATFDSGVTYSVNTSAGASVARGDAVAGDVIDFAADVANSGNVTLNYAGISLDGSWGAASDTKAKNHIGLVPGDALPFGPVKAKHLTSAGNGVFEPYTLTVGDVALGYVDLTTSVFAAPSKALFNAHADAYTHTETERVFLRDFTTKAKLTFTKATLNDTNGDGIGNEGETITYKVRFKNTSDQVVTIDSAYDVAGSDVVTPAGAALTGATLNPSETITKKWKYTITSADETRGQIDVGVTADYTGQADWATDSRTAVAPSITTGAYVAPPTTLLTSATYGDDNGDGFPSIGETVTVTVTASNTGAYPLTHVVVGDAPGSDVTALLPSFSSTIAGGASDTHTFVYVLTAADFARGSLVYSSEITADGLATTASSTSVNLTGITFQAYESDLDTMIAGGISVCLPDMTSVDTVVIGSTVNVTPGASCTYLGSPAGARVVGFSTPMMMGMDTFTVKVPGAIGVGAHRIALYGADGALVGWKNVQVNDPIAFSARGGSGELASTGNDSRTTGWLMGGASALILWGTASVVVGLRPRRWQSS